MAAPVTTPASPEAMLKQQRFTQWFRRLAAICFGTPFLVTALIVLVNRLTNGGLSFFVDDVPWTHRFWSTLYYMFVAGCVLLLLTTIRQCPRCGNGFFRRSGFNLREKERPSHTGIRWNINIFARECLNCGLRVDGSNLTS